MASLETQFETVSATGGITSHFDELLRGISSELSPEELKHAVSLIKSNFKGVFEDQEEQELYSCFLLFAKQGLVSEDNLTLLECLTSKTSKNERIQEIIQGFRAIRQRKKAKKGELTGRVDDLKQVMTKLTTGSSSVVNLYGSSGVGKTTLAKETLSKWPGRKFKVDLRGINEVRSLHSHILNALTVSRQTVPIFEANPVIARMEQLKRDSQSDILLLLDNVDQFAGEDGEASSDLNTKFVTFLRSLLGPKTEEGISKVRILLTSRITLRHSDNLDVYNYEVKALDNKVSSLLLQTLGNLTLEENEREKMVEMCRGNPFILNGVAAILRQKLADDKKLLETIQQDLEKREKGLSSGEDRQVTQKKNVGIDKDQENVLKTIFFFLPSKRLQESAVSVSLFCRSFSVEAAATILGMDSSEAVVQLEGLRNSKVISVDPEEKVLSYDIHPLMREFLRSIGNSNVFIKVYQKAKERFCSLFMFHIKEISAILDGNYLDAFNRFDLDKPNFELALKISLESDRLFIPEEHHESIMICYLFEAMLDEKQRRSIFNSWAEKAENDRKQGSLLRAELKCREALQVLELEGWQRALAVLKMANESLKLVQKENKHSDLFKLTRSSYLFVKGEVYYRAGNVTKALRILHRSLKIMEDILQSHTSTTRCLNAIGNCHNRLDKPDEAIKYYTRAYEMRKELSGSMNHFDMPVFKGQIGTAYEGRAQIYRKERQDDEAEKQFRKAIECYQEALELAKKLRIPAMLETALFNRNIANTYSWLGEFEEAYQPAKNAYEIRKDILGNHPCTARSAFQMAEICVRLQDYDEAEEFYKEAWEIEKSLGQGNHSEVMVRIVDSYEAMLQGVRKAEFQKETFEFYLRYWNEERDFERFVFSSINMKVIDSIIERLYELGDLQTQNKYRREALWFYEGAWNSPDTKKLPDLQRKDILQKLLQLCNLLRENDLLQKYKAKTFRFYERLWKKNRENMERQDKIDILTQLEYYASSLKDEKTAQKYRMLKKETTLSNPFFRSFKALFSFGSSAEQLSSDDDDDSDADVIDQDNENDNDDDDSSNESQDTTEQLSQLAIEEQVLEGLEDSDNAEPDRIKIHEGIVTSEGTHWDLEEWAVHVTFPGDAVPEPTVIEIHKWKSAACSPKLQEHEAVVSNVIEISTSSDEALEFKAEVKLTLSHSAADLHGYELVVYKLTNKHTNEWEDVGGTDDFRNLSDIEDEYHSAKDVPDFRFPVAQAEIRGCSTYTIVYRLKSSPPYIIASKGGSFNLPEYPNVCVTIPKKAVASRAKIPLQIKVQEVPRENFAGKEILVGPILRISCGEVVEFLKPVTIQLPISLGGEQLGIPDVSQRRVRVLFQRSDDEQEEWVEITEDVKNSARFDGKTVRFQVQRFSGSRYACFLDWGATAFSINAGVIEHLSSLICYPPQMAVFFVYIPPGHRSGSQDMLHLICCPSHVREQVTKELQEKSMNFPGDADSEKKMIPGHDKAYVFLSGGIRALGESDDMKNFHLRFEGDKRIQGQVAVSVINETQLCGVTFYSSPKLERESVLCKLHFRLASLKRDFKSTPAEFFGVPVSDQILLQARAEEVLAIGKRFVDSATHDSHLRRLSSLSYEEVMQSFLEALAGMSSERQDECFQALVTELKDGHVINRLTEGRNAVSRPLTTNHDVLLTVSEEVGHCWKNLARELNLGRGKIETISLEEDGQKLCYKALARWCQENGEEATIRKLMLALNKSGLADVNKSVINCLNLT